MQDWLFSSAKFSLFAYSSQRKKRKTLFCGPRDLVSKYIKICQKFEKVEHLKLVGQKCR